MARHENGHSIRGGIRNQQGHDSVEMSNQSIAGSSIRMGWPANFGEEDKEARGICAYAESQSLLYRRNLVMSQATVRKPRAVAKKPE